MNIHEYQAKEILSRFGVSIPKGGVAYSPENAKDRATELGGDLWAVSYTHLTLPTIYSV